ncbi:type IX secretion system membrane protein PorP/SprF [Hyunsoonleella flava]|uniref:Type IX secretion system membrane protein PorP/SprF n=1 Tax=Hyunsoonleella flava TaxID=2527939 RepID=A0A4Q9FJV5_9FLAO|nr:PorP/SprF family type IX secretion system membrane protein [Hyunsoonleella flava]TBN04665.1 type IX secretion system membrane protein PorP/SprF [Hyunsoonleella flava]
MNKYLLYMFLVLCTIQQFHSQESNGIVALALPVRNSLKFNRYAINPTFSFVREQNKYISFTNKKQWAQFNDAPHSYLFSYSGRFSENIGAGIGLFQQDFGVLTTFGGILNFAYNTNISRESNLTFGLNIGAYQSRLNEGKVVVNTPDPSLQNIPSNFLITVNPGINYGTDFFDFGVAINNLVSYNLNESQIIEDNPEQALQAHIMYTGYMNSRGFFDESRFSTLIRSEFKKDQTVISGLAMLNVPKGIWAQAGYNTLYGASAGLGINITNNIAIEYNYEQSMGDFSGFGSSHEITLAYRFKKNYRYNYGDDEEEQSVFNSNKKRKSRPNNLTEEDRTRIAERRAEIAAQRKAAAEAKAKQVTADTKVDQPEVTEDKTVEIDSNETEVKAVVKEKPVVDEQEKQQQEAEKRQVEEQARLRAENEARKKLELEKQTKAEEEARQKIEAEKAARLKLQAEQKAKEALEKAKAEEAERLLQEAEKQRIEELERVKAEEEARKKQETERLEAEAIARAKAEAEEQARLKFEAEQKAKEALENEKAEEAKRLQEEAERKRIEEEARIKAEQEERQKIEAEKERERAETEEKARLEQERLNTEKEEATPAADDEVSKAMSALVNETAAAKKAQNELMKKLAEKIAVKQKDLDDLKEENDLSEKGIYLAPKPFKSLSAENAEIETLKDEIEKVEKDQEIKMIELEALLIKRKRKFRKDAEGINEFYINALDQIKADQLRIKSSKERLISNLEKINEDTDFERKRRIRRAAYDNQQDRYNKDKAALARIKKFTDESAVPLQEEDFDFGEEQTKNIQIIKNVLNEESGYYMVIAVHNSVEKRDEFLEKVVASGEKNVNFFFDVKTNKYFIYYEKFDSISQAKNALDQKGSKPYNGKMSLVKIDN